jgi:excisionase family DNA binding protein
MGGKQAPTISPEPIALRINDACRAIGVGRTTIYKLAAEGKLRLVRVAGRTLVLRANLVALIENADAQETA